MSVNALGGKTGHAFSGAVFAIAAAVACAAQGGEERPAANLLTNPAFEDVSPSGAPAGWIVKGSRFSFAPGEGRNGTKAMKWDASVPSAKEGSRLSQRIPIKVGRHYKFEAWVRTEGLKCGTHGATVWIDWCDAKDKWINETYLFGVKDPDSDWRKVDGVTVRMPTNAAYAVFMAGVEAGKAGKAYFDDFRICELVDNPVPMLVSDRYRDAAHDGKVTFSAALDLKAAKLEEGTAKGEFSYRAADGSLKRVPAESFTARCATFALPVSSLAMGRNEVAFRLLGVDGHEAGKAAIPFTRLAAPPAWRVTIDRHRRVVVNGKPFFPLGLYNGGLSKGQVAKYWKGSPFNCIMPYSMPAPDEVDFAYTNGLMSMVSLKDAYFWSPRRAEAIASEADEERFVTETVAKFKDKPGLLAWYVNDETDIGKAATLAARRDLLERLDPDHPTWGVIYQIHDASGYVRTADVHGSDPYPIPGDIGSAFRQAVTMRAGSLGTRAIWQVPQIFDWSQYHKPPRPGERAPTENEMRSMFWQAIAGGANGIVCYAFHCLWAMRAKDPFEKRWAECCKVAGEVREHFPVLLSDPAEFKFAGEVPQRLGVRSWSYGGGKAVLFVNAGREDLKAALSPSVRVCGVERLFGDGSVSLREDGAVAVSMPPLGVALVKFRDKQCEQ